MFEKQLNKIVMLAYIFLLASVVSANFLMYSVANAEKLHIKMYHPRIIVEFLLAISFVVAGLILIN